MKTIKRFIYLLFQWGRYFTPYTQITFTYSKLTKETLEKRCEICSKLTIKETLAQVFSCEFCKISKNAFFTEHLWKTASDIIQLSLAIFPHKTISYFLVQHVLFSAKNIFFIIDDVFEKSNEWIVSFETAKLTKRKLAEVFNI